VVGACEHGIGPCAIQRGVSLDELSNLFNKSVNYLMWKAWPLSRAQLSLLLILYVKLINYKPVNCPREDLVPPSISACLPRHCLLIADHGNDNARPISCCRPYKPFTPLLNCFTY
jgi:hypothetical protein